MNVYSSLPSGWVAQVIHPFVVATILLSQTLLARIYSGSQLYEAHPVGWVEPSETQQH